ncbi:MAG: carbohydrate ABC transporter permease [Cellulosilyticaceae bacterium]
MDIKKQTNSVTSRILHYLGYFIICLWIAFTIAAIGWIFLASVSTTKEIFNNEILKTGLHFESYIKVFQKHNILRYFGNSLLYTTVGCVGVVIIGAPAAYALSNYVFRGRGAIQTAYASTMGIPGIMLMIPVYMLMGQLKLTKNIGVLMIIYIAISLPFTIFFLSSFFATIPSEIQESALVDGSSHIKAFWKVIFPLAQPGLVTVTIFNFVGMWNEYMWGLIFANSSKRRTLALGLQAIVDSMRTSGDWAGLFAAVVIVFIPTFVMFILLSDKIIGGITSGAVKG